MADTPPVAGPLPLWYTNAAQVRQFPGGLPGWGGGPDDVFESLDIDPRDGDAAPPTPDDWAPEHDYTFGQRAVIAGDTPVTLTCIDAGTSAGAPPRPPGTGNTVTDGTVTWRQV